jgi:predicted ATPase
VPPGHRLRATLAGAQKDGNATLLHLDRLDVSDVDLLFEAALPGNSDPALSARLNSETEGLPLFVAEYLTALQASGMSSADWSVPPGIQELLRDRISRLSSTARQLLTAAAVLGRAFGFDLLQEVSGRSEEEVLDGVDELLSQRLLEERGVEAEGYDFCHEQLRALVYDDAGLARRRLLHRRAANAIARSQRGRRESGSSAAVIANHLRLASDEEEAAGYYKTAGDHARSLHANAEARSHYELALALGHPESAALHDALGDLRTLAGDYGAAVTCYETAAALAAQNDLPALERKLGNVYQRGGEWEMAEQHLENALIGFEQSSQLGQQARALADLSLIAYRRGEHELAQERSQRAAALAEEAGDEEAVAQAHNIIGIQCRARGDNDGAEEHLRRSLRLAEQRRDDAGRLAALNNLALVLLEREELGQALVAAQTALDASVTLGDRHREAAIRNNLADIHHKAGNTEEAMVQLKQAVTIFAEVGLSADSVEPEIWKLLEW